MAMLIGKWLYKSYCPRVAAAGPPAFPSQLAAPWAPDGELDVTTDPTGKVTGTLKFLGTPIVLSVTGQVTPPTADIPEGVELTGTGLGAVYKLRGFFIAIDYAVVGTVLCTDNDLGKRPIGTQGPFILLPGRILEQTRKIAN